MSEQNESSLDLSISGLLGNDATSHNKTLIYRLIVARYPDSLITEDEWGALHSDPLYAIWGNASQDIVKLLIDSKKSALPNYTVDWDNVIETLCWGRGESSLDVVERLLNINVQQAFFSDSGQSVNWLRQPEN